MKRKLFFTTGMVVAGSMALFGATDAQLAEAQTKAAEYAADPMLTANNIWMMLCAAFVFLMHLGFGCVESGFTQSKNTVNILFKNTAIVAIGILTYTICGFNLMYPGDISAGNMFPAITMDTFGISPLEPTGLTKLNAEGAVVMYNSGYSYWTDFIFQAMFAATAATIVSGAVAERIKLGPFLIFCTLFVGISYPITGFWHWGGGFLKEAGFYDFAGSSIVHGVGGWGALIAAFLLGPRKGKYDAQGNLKPILGHNMPLAMIGVFLLWLGWFGFNGGSILSANAGGTSLTLVTTCLAAAAGVIGAMLTTWILFRKPDLGMVLNGSLAGLVGITAGANIMFPLDAVIVGLIAGVLVVFSVRFFDAIKIDDPVGAISVHLVCGIWGTLAVAIFGDEALFKLADAAPATIGTQLKGIAAYGAVTAVVAFVLLFVLKMTVGIRVSEEEEVAGLDISEHGAHAYPTFTK
jgi:ammonium transporter, Amt family